MTLWWCVLCVYCCSYFFAGRGIQNSSVTEKLYREDALQERTELGAVVRRVSALRRLSLTQTTHQNSLTTACANSLKKSFSVVVVVYLTAKNGSALWSVPHSQSALFFFFWVKNIALTWEKLETKWEKARKSLLSLEVILFRLSSTFCCCLQCFLFGCYYTLCNNGVGF